MSTFKGFLREDGAVGVRNHILVLSTVVCANVVAERVARRVQGAVAFCHTNGCGQIGEDLSQTIRTLAGIGRNPNVFGTLIVSLGCEGVAACDILNDLARNRKNIELVTIQEGGGTSGAIRQGERILRGWQKEWKNQKRVPCQLKDLTVGLECGGSDTSSGIAANPVMGYVSDRVVSMGGKVILSETTEMIGAEHLLAARTTNGVLAKKLLDFVKKTEDSAKAMKVDLRGTQPTPGNIKGGLTTIEEKSLGCLAKAGHSRIVEVVGYAEQPTKQGLIVMDTPGYDVESVTGMLAGGAQIFLFSTGRGTPVGCPIAPVIKVTGNPRTAERMRENIDLDASGLTLGRQSIEEIGDGLFALLRKTASGRKTASERLGHTEASITRIGPSV